TECLIPKSQNPFERFADGRQTAKPGNDRPRGFHRFGLAKQKDHFTGLTRSEFDHGLNRRAWIKSGAIAATKRNAPHGRRICQRAVATYEFFAVARHRETFFAGCGKRDSICKLVVIWIARENCAPA